MGNIFTTENIAKYNTKPRYAGVGEYVLRNGVWAMDIRPEPFWENFEPQTSTLLKDEFVPNTQYILDMWIDGDDTIYQGNNVPCGLEVVYTDGTKNYTLVVTGGTNVGFQHVYYVTDSTKSVKMLGVYYYTSMPVYYRADSFILPLSNSSNVHKSGIANTTSFNEQITGVTNAKIGKGYIESNQFYEL